MDRRTAGLTLSVGQARFPVRLLIATVFAFAAGAMMYAGVAIAPAAGLLSAIVAIVLIEPMALIAFLAVAFIVAPHSGYGAWLDAFVPKLRRPAIALSAALFLWIVSAVIVWKR